MVHGSLGSIHISLTLVQIGLIKVNLPGTCVRANAKKRYSGFKALNVANTCESSTLSREHQKGAKKNISAISDLPTFFKYLQLPVNSEPSFDFMIRIFSATVEHPPPQTSPSTFTTDLKIILKILRRTCARPPSFIRLSNSCCWQLPSLRSPLHLSLALP